MMSTTTTEEHHESSSKRKPRLPQSQGDQNRIHEITLRLAKQNMAIEKVKLRDYKRIAKTLSIGFSKDPFVNNILNTDKDEVTKRKSDLMQSFFEYSVYECFNFGGEVYVIKDVALETELEVQEVRGSRIPYIGCILWVPLKFNNHEFDYPEHLNTFSGMHPSSLKFSYFASLSKCRLKVKTVTPLLDSKRSDVLSSMNLNFSCNRIWYLSDLCVIPTMQGRGLARDLINYCLFKLVDVMPNSWCYLECSNQQNRKFYYKLGFEIIKTFPLKEDDESDMIYLDAMLRVPVVRK